MLWTQPSPQPEAKMPERHETRWEEARRLGVCFRHPLRAAWRAGSAVCQSCRERYYKEKRT